MKMIIKIISAILVIISTISCLTACTESGKTEETTAMSQTEANTDKTDETTAVSQTEENTEKPQETTAEAPVIKRTFYNPVTDISAPDPFVVYHDGYYYCLFTLTINITLYRSKTIENILEGEKKVLIEMGDEIGCYLWAPELHYLPTTGRWYVYSCGSTKGFDFDGVRMICLESESDDPFSDYKFKGTTDPDMLAIDQTVYYDEESGNLYTAFSQYYEDAQVITVALMDDPWTISDKRSIVSMPKYMWEKRSVIETNSGKINEGPVFLKHNGEIFLIYSASGCWSEYYCLGLLHYIGKDTSAEEFVKAENWEKSRNPVFKKANGVYGVGHCSFFTSPDGTETWMAYHGMATPDAGVEGRNMYIQKIDFDENGFPALGKPISRETPIEVPSGEE